jgi:hypothetical protein
MLHHVDQVEAAVQRVLEEIDLARVQDR